MKRTKAFELDFDFTQPEELIKAEIRRRVALGKISPQGAKVVLESYYNDAMLELKKNDQNRKRLETYHKIGQTEQIAIEIQAKQLSSGK